MAIDVVKGKAKEAAAVEPEAKTEGKLMSDEKKKKDEEEEVEEVTLAGFYHLMWDTQMGEETFAVSKTDELCIHSKRGIPHFK